MPNLPPSFSPKRVPPPTPPSRNGRGAASRKRRGGSPARRLVARALVLIAGVVAAFASGSLLGTAFSPSPGGPTGAPRPLVARIAQAVVPGPHERMNVLVMGQDVSYRGEPSRSDTMFVASLDPQRGRIDLLSIPRDSRVAIPGHGLDKINAALAYGGPQLSLQTVRDFLGVPVDHFVLMKLDGLRRLVDAVGGVDVYVDHNLFYTDHHAGLYIRLKKGWRHLDGNSAEQFVRFRHDLYGDITRVQRQQRFVQAVQAKLLQPATLLRLPALVQVLAQNVQTDLAPADLLTWATWAKGVGKDHVHMVLLPGSFSGNQFAASYWLVDPREAHRLAVRLLTEPPPAAASASTPVAEDPGSFTAQSRVLDTVPTLAPVPAPEPGTAKAGGAPPPAGGPSAPGSPARAAAPTQPAAGPSLADRARILATVPLARRASIRITVLNGTRTPRLAHEAARLLRSDGWTVWEVGSAARRDARETTIAARSGQEELATPIAASLGVAAHPDGGAAAASSQADFTVVLGADFLQALRTAADHR